MKACMLAYTFYETDNRVMRYAETLVKEGHTVDVIALRKEGQSEHEFLDGVNVYRIQERSVNEKAKLTYLFRIVKFLRKSAFFLTRKNLQSPYDLIHVHSIPDFEAFAAFAPKLMGAKVILDIHDIVPEFYASKFGVDRSSLSFRLLTLVERASISFCDHVIISNHIWKDTLTSRSVKPEKCTVLMNYPDNSLFHRRIGHKHENDFRIIYPGTLNFHQGLDIAIKAFSLIREEVPNATIYIYGEGSSKPLLKQLVKNLGLEDRVQLKDFVPIKEIPEIMAAADLGIIPKRNDFFGGEAFSTKALEFMSLGVPVIISRTKIDEYYFNDSIVKFFKPGNPESLAESMLLLIQNPEMRRSLAQNASKFVEKNCWDVKKDIYLDLVDSLVNGRAMKGNATPGKD